MLFPIPFTFVGPLFAHAFPESTTRSNARISLAAATYERILNASPPAFFSRRASLSSADARAEFFSHLAGGPPESSVFISGACSWGGRNAAVD